MVVANNKRDNFKKEDIIKNIHLDVGISVSYAGRIVNDIISILLSNFKLNKKLKIKNFGIFTVKKKNKRLGRNPKNNDKHYISERTVVTFKASENFTKKIKENE